MWSGAARQRFDSLYSTLDAMVDGKSSWARRCVWCGFVHWGRLVKFSDEVHEYDGGEVWLLPID